MDSSHVLASAVFLVWAGMTIWAMVVATYEKRQLKRQEAEKIWSTLKNGI